jgi:hypothetical protein
VSHVGSGPASGTVENGRSVRATACHSLNWRKFVPHASIKRRHQRITAISCDLPSTRTFLLFRRSQRTIHWASQAENAGSIPVARSRQTSQFRPAIHDTLNHAGRPVKRGRATNVQQRATRTAAFSATQAENSFGLAAKTTGFDRSSGTVREPTQAHRGYPSGCPGPPGRRHYCDRSNATLPLASGARSQMDREGLPSRRGALQ